MNSVGDFLNTYTYDVLGQLTTLTQEGMAGGHTVAPKRVDFAYNKVGQFSQISRSAARPIWREVCRSPIRATAITPAVT